VRLALWTPSPDATWLRALRPHLERGAALAVVDAPPDRPVDVDLHLHHLANDERHGFVFREFRERPGLVLLEEWDLHRAVREATAGRGDGAAWHAAARRAGGDAGAFVASLLDRGPEAPWLTALLPLAATELGGALGAVAFTADGGERLRALRPGLPLAHLALPLLAAESPAADAAADRPAPDRPVLAVRVPSAAAAAARVEAALAGLDRSDLERRDVRPGDDSAAILRRADLLVALDDPGSGRLDPLLGLALRAGIPTLVTAGSAAGRELPEGVVARVSPGETEAAELRALVRRLAADRALRARMGALARAYAAAVADPARAATILLALARAACSGPAARAPAVRPAPLAAHALEEVGWAARSAGLHEAPPGVAALVESLFGGR
jgi:hypothetical protein